MPLDEGAGEIRLLYLLPGHLPLPLRVILELTPFSPNNPSIRSIIVHIGLSRKPHRHICRIFRLLYFGSDTEPRRRLASSSS
ncbi:hypothetical protein V8E51_003082 [Hyaloscypha variabilis]